MRLGGGNAYKRLCRICTCKAFKRAAQGVILLDVKFSNILAKAVYDPGSSGIVASSYLVKKANIGLSRIVTLNLVSKDGVITIKREVFNALNVKMKGKYLGCQPWFCQEQCLIPF